MKKTSSYLILAALFLGSANLPSMPVAAQTAKQQNSDALQDALRRIARNPNNSSALADAGLAALALGDTRAAIGFLAKADEIYPNSGRVKVGLGRSLLAEENPFGAIRYFNQAVQNGVPARQIATDRGLALDLIGRNAEAQKDYQLALQYGQDETLRKRYAISLGITGAVEEADAQLDPLLRESNRDAWRNKAFILAMNGQEEEANSIARQMMPRRMAEAIGPFFERMPQLTAAQKAAAVHYGHFPASENVGVDVAAVRLASRRGAVRGGTGADAGLIPVGPPLGENIQKPRVLAMPDRSPRRRPGSRSEDDSLEQQISSLTREDVQLTSRTELPAPLPGSGADLPAVKVTEKAAATTIPPAANDIESSPAGNGTPVNGGDLAKPDSNAKAVAEAGFETDLGVGSSAPLVSESVERKVAIGNVQPPVRPAPAVPDIAATDLAPAAATPVNLVNFDLAAAPSSTNGPDISSSSAGEKKSLSEIMKTIEIPEKETKRDVVPVNLDKIEAARPAPPKAKPVAEKPKPPAHPQRFWVQIATGADRDALKYDFRRMARKHGNLFKGKDGWTSRWGRTRRLVVGPFDNLKQAKSFESEFRKGGGDGFAWISATGTEVSKLTQ